MILLTSESSVSRLFSLGFKTSFQGFFLDSLNLFLIPFYLSQIPLLDTFRDYMNFPERSDMEHEIATTSLMT